MLATEFIALLETMREYKLAYDRLGDKKYNQSRRAAVTKLIELLRATALAARAK